MPVKPDLPRPPSAVSSATGWWGVLAFCVALASIKLGQFSPLFSVFLVLTLPLAAMLAWEITVVQPWRAPDAQVHRKLAICTPPDLGRLARKLLGTATALLMLALWFSMVGYYNASYHWIFHWILYSAPVWMVAGVAYMNWLDPRMPHPYDGAWHLGELLVAKLRLPLPAESPRPGKPKKQVQVREALRFLQVWFIKGFFFVFLMHLLPGNIAQLQRESFDPWSNLYRLVFTLTPLLFTIDIVLACIGYLCTFKVLNAHIRSPNQSWLGWISALICYPPFVIIGVNHVFNLQAIGMSAPLTIPLDYRVGGTFWDLWIRNPWVQWLWAIPMLVCLFVYVWATVAFGIRFSNLTNRGTLTHGPYRLLRHPAYVSKNVYWWLIFVPWVNQFGPKQALICCALLLLLNGVYYLRARTEEAHLSTDPEYRAYRHWFDNHTMWQRIRAK
jgi:hypothetical protein